MKKSELKQLIREEIRFLLVERIKAGWKVDKTFAKFSDRSGNKNIIGKLIKIKGSNGIFNAVNLKTGRKSTQNYDLSIVNSKVVEPTKSQIKKYMEKMK